MPLVDAVLSAFINVIILGVIPFGAFYLVHRWRHKTAFKEVVHRAGFRLGETRYIWYCLGFSAVLVVLLLVWPPSIEHYSREGSPQRDFVGLGLTAESTAMALLYGVVKTGFPEELLFRGLIAGSLGRRLPPVWANVLQAFIFFLPHLAVLTFMPEFWPVLPLVFVGALFLGWVRTKSGSFYGPWLVHAAVNVTVCLSVAIRSSGM
jgi:membrane protease YdiL (CAAX protease family)